MINYGKQWVDEDDIAAVVAVLKSDFLTQGPKVLEFENALAAYVGAEYAVAVSNGTAALHLAVRALDINGYEGLTAPNTFTASANCFLYNGLTPGFVDIDRRTYCMDAAELEKQITPKTRVVIPVHFAGQPAEIETVDAVTKGKNIHVIEDASHAVGSKYGNGKMVGSCCYSDMATFSFHPVKTIATGEGGAVTTNDPELYQKLLLLRNHGITKDASKFVNPAHAAQPGPWYYEMQELGFNYRLTDIQAALGLGQLKKIKRFIKRRREIVKRYNQVFKYVPFLTVPHEREDVFSAFHLYVLQIDFDGINKSRTRVMQELREKGIGTQVHYIPVHLQPYYREHFGFKDGDFPVSEDYYNRCLSIPLYPKMSNDDIDHVIEAVAGLEKEK